MSIFQSADCKLCDFLESKSEIETSFNRVEKQKAKCKFGKNGVCCKLCSNGPCKITPNSPRGVCGADADTIVARNFLRAISAGSACYLHVVENTAWNLKNIGLGKGNIKLKSIETLNALAESFGIKEEDTNKKAVKVAEEVLNDLYKPRFEKMELVEKLSYSPRFKRWKELDILPGGAKAEVFDALVKTSTNLSSDPTDMLLNALSLGISTGIYGLVLTNLLNDVILGAPKIREAKVGFRVIDENYINIMVTGHQHSMIAHLQDKLIEKEIKNKAEKAGAKGFRIVGCTCVGQDLQLRGEHYTEVFPGHAGNNYTSEAVLATGGIDLVLSEFNCTIPGLEAVASKFEVTMICIDDVAKKKDAALLKFDMEKVEEISNIIIDAALKSYKKRRKLVNIDIPKDHGHDDVVTGVSEGSLRDFLGGSYQPIINLIAEGKIKGVAGVVGCSNLTAKGHDVFTVELTKELIKRDILVLSAGCSSGGLENVGLMSKSAAKLAGNSLRQVCETLGIPPVLNFGPCLAIGRLEMVAVELAAALNIDIPKLPLVMSAPQWLEEQALADASFGLTLGLPIHVAISPFIDGSELVSKTLKEDLVDITGGKLIVEEDVLKAADELEQIIEDRRKTLNLK